MFVFIYKNEQIQEKEFVELPSLFLHMILFQNGCQSGNPEKTKENLFLEGECAVKDSQDISECL